MLKIPEESFRLISLAPAALFPFAIPAVLIHRTGNPTNRWHLGRRADKLAPTCRSTKSLQSRRALARQEPRGVEMPEESAISRLSSWLNSSSSLLTWLQVCSWLLTGAGGRRKLWLCPEWDGRSSSG